LGFLDFVEEIMKRMVIAGANGFMGRALVEHFTGYDIHTLTRRPLDILNTTNHIWDGETLGNWASSLDGAEVLINLAGRSVNCRYNQANQAAILESRVKSTAVLGTAVQQGLPPKVWLNSSTATIYRHAEDRPMTEQDGDIGSGFSVEVAKAWEKTLENAYTPHTRKIALRTAMVLGKGGGVLPVMANLARYGLGGSMGNGQQYISWVHEQDVCSSIEFLINSKTNSSEGFAKK
jgi:uncharacterized protein